MGAERSDSYAMPSITPARPFERAGRWPRVTLRKQLDFSCSRVIQRRGRQAANHAEQIWAGEDDFTSMTALKSELHVRARG
jgi:hypothetical protein